MKHLLIHFLLNVSVVENKIMCYIKTAPFSRIYYLHFTKAFLVQFGTKCTKNCNKNYGFQYKSCDFHSCSQHSCSHCYYLPYSGPNSMLLEGEGYSLVKRRCDHCWNSWNIGKNAPENSTLRPKFFRPWKIPPNIARNQPNWLDWSKHDPINTIFRSVLSALYTTQHLKNTMIILSQYYSILFPLSFVFFQFGFLLFYFGLPVHVS